MQKTNLVDTNGSIAETQVLAGRPLLASDKLATS